VVGVHFDRGEIRCAQVVDEPCDVAIPVGIDTKRVAVSALQIEQVRVFSGLCLGIRDDFPDVLTDKRPLGDFVSGSNAPAHSVGSENLEPCCDAML